MAETFKAIVFALCLTSALATPTPPKPTSVLVKQDNFTETTLRLCVPEINFSLCNQMLSSTNNTSIQCVSAPDKTFCISQIIKGSADWMVLEPEELYLSHLYLPKNSLLVVSEIRSAEYSNRSFRYEPTAVIRKSSDIQSIRDLRGKRSCHTGFGKTSGWRVPFSYLFKARQLNCVNSTILPAIEQDLVAVKNFFGQTCAPGKWTTDPQIDILLKQKYPELCQLCSNPKECSSKDKYSNYDGALRCLTENQGDVAWTKHDAVRNFFQLGTNSTVDSSEYELLCPDGSTSPIDTPNPCIWARRPWDTLVISARFSKNIPAIQELQQQYSKLCQTAQQSTPVPEWLTKVLNFYKTTDVEYHYDPVRVRALSPMGYLRPTKYLNTLWHPSCGIMEKSLKFCVESQMEFEKCQTLKLASIGQRISPGFSCVVGSFPGHCNKLVANGEADLLIANPILSDKIQNSSTPLVPILREVVKAGENSVPFIYALTVIHANIANKFEDSIAPILDKKLCHGNSDIAHLSVLKEANVLTGDNCNLTKLLELHSFSQVGTAERYQGSLGAINCLQDNVAEVGFTDHFALLEKKKNGGMDNIKLLCRNGTVTELENYKECHWGLLPTFKILARGGDEHKVRRENAKASLLKAQDLFGSGGKKEVGFRMFGDYYGAKNLLFQDSGAGLQNELNGIDLEAENKMSREFGHCDDVGKRPTFHSR